MIAKQFPEKLVKKTPQAKVLILTLFSSLSEPGSQLRN